ncbi:MAG: hypothetical protein CMA10_04660 [Euryarchaeota archaeon]|nr:hypothetical protein [Euryarchaeota archaeon]|tara:strand:+ start:17548 stop:17916 length:369 start_codon:yes stop_codon:yes gene_type:complete
MTTLSLIVKEYVALDDEIVESMKLMKGLRARRTELQEQVLDEMEAQGFNEVQITGGKLSLKSSKSTESIKRDLVIQHIQHAFNCAQTDAEAVADQIWMNRNTTQKRALSRTKKRERGTSADE